MQLASIASNAVTQNKQPDLRRMQPGGGKGVDLIQEHQAARDVIGSLQQVGQLLLTLAIPLGHDGFQRDIHQRH